MASFSWSSERIRRGPLFSYRGTGRPYESERLESHHNRRKGGLMGESEKQPDETAGVTVDEPTEPVLNPEDDDLGSDDE
jgi:hypothetical protein